MLWKKLSRMQSLSNMSKNLIDTNLIIRFLVNDDPQKVKRVERLLQNTANKNILLDTVVAEIVWVLSSYYSLNKKEVIEKVTALIHVATIECNTFLLSRALTIWEEHAISYIDAYVGAVAELGNMILYSYDRKLKTIDTITVSEP